MKTQILSRIQSYQSIRSKSITNQDTELNSRKTKIYPQELSTKYLNFSKKLNNETHRLNSMGNFTHKKQKNTTTYFEPIKRSLERTKIGQLKNQKTQANLNTWEQKKHFMLPKKISYKRTPIEEIRSLYPKDSENQPNRQNTVTYQNQQISSQKSLERQKNIKSSKQFSEEKITSKKDFMKVFSRRNLYRQYLPNVCTTSQKNIQIDKSRPEKSYETLVHEKNERVNKMAKTTGIFIKEKKANPYFQMSHQKVKGTIDSINGKSNDISEGQDSPIRTHKQDVSIQLSDGNQEEKLNSISEQQELEFSCSHISEAKMENDSSFLDASQKEILATMGQSHERSKKVAKRWKKLPADFLKT